jgi:hypothetical protein
MDKIICPCGGEIKQGNFKHFKTKIHLGWENKTSIKKQIIDVPVINLENFKKDLKRYK